MKKVIVPKKNGEIGVQNLMHENNGKSNDRWENQTQGTILENECKTSNNVWEKEEYYLGMLQSCFVLRYLK